MGPEVFQVKIKVTLRHAYAGIEVYSNSQPGTRRNGSVFNVL